MGSAEVAVRSPVIRVICPASILCPFPVGTEPVEAGSIHIAAFYSAEALLRPDPDPIVIRIVDPFQEIALIERFDCDDIHPDERRDEGIDDLF